jgi:hypothetical protein
MRIFGSISVSESPAPLNVIIAPQAGDNLLEALLEKQAGKR